MGDRSAIEWTDATWNPIRARNRVSGRTGWFCTHAGEGCRNCYAEGFNRRLGTGVDYKAQLQDQVELFLDERILSQPLRWRRPRQVFVGSMTDPFGEFVPDWMIDRIWAVMALARHHTFQVLTKRSNRLKAFVRNTFADDGLVRLMMADVPHSAGTRQLIDLVDVGHCTTPLPNVWLGVSTEDQPTYVSRWADLRETPAFVRFISAEPLLAAIDMDLPDAVSPDPRPDWVIVGGESGPHARPMHPDWVRHLRDDCAAAGVAFFFKQWGEWLPMGQKLANGDISCVDRGERPGLWSPETISARLGKKRTGNLLDGHVHDAQPFNPAAAARA